MLVATNDEIKFWYEHCQNQQNSLSTLLEYSREFNLDSKLLSNWKQRFNPWHSKYANEKKREQDLYELYRATNPVRSKFCAKHNLPVHRLSIISAHYGYMDRLKEIYVDELYEPFNQEDYMDEPDAPPEPQPMKFITRQEQQPIIPISTAPEAEVIEEQNDIELTITKGVKVILTPDFPALKIIKIIELLKDL